MQTRTYLKIAYSDPSHFAELVGLSALEQDVPAFAALCSKYALFDNCLHMFGEQDVDSLCDLLALALGSKPKELKQVLQPSSGLCGIWCSWSGPI